MREKPVSYKIPRRYSLVGNYLKELRVKAGLTQREVSLTLGYSSAQFISNFERGIALPPLKKFRTLGKMYDADSDKLVELTIESERILLSCALKAKGTKRLRLMA